MPGEQHFLLLWYSPSIRPSHDNLIKNQGSAIYTIEVMAGKKLQIRNSTAEFLIFTSQASENTIEVMVQDETVWLTQKMIAALFEVEVNTINYHLKEIFKSGELHQSATIQNFRIVQTEGKREVSRERAPAAASWPLAADLPRNCKKIEPIALHFLAPLRETRSQSGDIRKHYI